MYIVNFDNEQGYVVISSDVLSQGIIAIVEQGSLSSLDELRNGDMPTLYYALRANSAMRRNMGLLQDSLARVAAEKLETLPNGSNPNTRHIYNDERYRFVYGPWTLNDSTKTKCLRTHWSDRRGFATYLGMLSCEHYKSAGSYTAAMAQLGFYYSAPNSTYLWASMPVDYIGNDRDESISEGFKIALKTLYRDIANATISNFYCSNSLCHNYGDSELSSLSAAASKFNSMGLSATVVDIPYGPEASLDDLNYRMTHSQPVFMSALDAITSLHYSWVADGHVRADRIVKVYDKITGDLVFNEADRGVEITYPLRR